MSRVRADDYDDKRHAILDTAAGLFAEKGYANVNMVEIARACGTSKSVFYHYFSKKQDVLFEIMKEQGEGYLEQAEAIVSRAASAEQRLREFVTMWVARASEARAGHAVLTYELKFLAKRQQKAIVEIERRLIDRIAELIEQANPAVKQAGARDKTYALLLFGMLNWTEVWYRSAGPIGPGEMADRIYTIFLRGLESVKPRELAAPGALSSGVR